jgi:hypothetical protein
VNLTAGIVLLVVFGAMLWYGKPRNGVQRKFMQTWIVGILYTMLCLLVFVLGIASLVLSL